VLTQVGPDAPAADSPKGPTLQTFTADAVSALAGPAWLRRRRADAYQAFLATPLPSEKEEVWRYSPIDSLDLDTYRPAPPRTGPPAPGDQAEVDAWLAPSG